VVRRVKEVAVTVLVAFLAFFVLRGRVALAVVACALITAGVALWSVPAALITAGALLLADRLTDPRR